MEIFVNQGQHDILELLNKIEYWKLSFEEICKELEVKNDFKVIPKILRNNKFSKRTFKIYDSEFNGDLRKHYGFVDLLKYKNRVEIEYIKIS